MTDLSLRDAQGRFLGSPANSHYEEEPKISPVDARLQDLAQQLQDSNSRLQMMRAGLDNLERILREYRQVDVADTSQEFVLSPELIERLPVPVFNTQS